MSEQKKSPLVPVLIIIIVILVGAVGYLLFNTNEQSDLISQQENKIEADKGTIEAKVSELEELNLALTRAKMEMDELGKSNDTLDQQLAELNEYIKQVKAGNAKEIKNLKYKLSEYKSILDSKDKEIATLRIVADSLSTEVGNLNIEKSKMNDSIANLNTVKGELAQQVAIASVLKAESIKISAINKKDKESLKDEYKVKDIEKLKVVFNLGENKVARKDNKQIHFRLVEPSGAVLYDAATGGGFFNVEGKDIPYTDKKTVKFTNARQQVGFVYVKGSEYKAGKYTAEIYGDNTLIGSAEFIVK